MRISLVAGFLFSLSTIMAAVPVPEPDRSRAAPRESAEELGKVPALERAGVSFVSPLADSTSDGEYFVVACGNGRIKYARCKDAVPLRTFYFCDAKALSLSSDGRFLAVAGSGDCSLSSKIKVWNVEDGALVHTLESGSLSCSLLKFSRDSRYLASAAGRSMQLWDLCDGFEIASPKLAKRISHLAFTASEENTLILICEDGRTETVEMRDIPRSEAPK